MRRSFIVASLSVVALSLAALPAGAQERRQHDANAREHGGGQAATQSAPAPRQEARPQAVPRQQAARAENGYPQSVPRQQGPRGENAYPQGRAVPRYEGRAERAPAYRPEARGRYAGPRGNDRDYRPAPNYGYARPGYDGRYARPGYYGRYTRPYNYVPYRPYYFGRPYYSFRPYRSFSFGLWLGYPVPYPYAYLGSYSPRVYGYYPDSSYGVSVYGGVSFAIQPMDADVFVDGQYAGRTGDFTPGAAPLTLTPGVHHIAVQRDGFEPMEWDVTVQPGQVIPYRGDMQAY